MRFGRKERESSTLLESFMQNFITILPPPILRCGRQADRQQICRLTRRYRLAGHLLMGCSGDLVVSDRSDPIEPRANRLRIEQAPTICLHHGNTILPTDWPILHRTLHPRAPTDRSGPCPHPTTALFTVLRILQRYVPPSRLRGRTACLTVCVLPLSPTLALTHLITIMGYPDPHLPGPRSYLNEPHRWSRTSPEPVAAPPSLQGPRMSGTRVEPLADNDPYERPASIHPTSIHSPPLEEKPRPSQNPMKAFDDFEKDSEAIYEAVRRGSDSSSASTARRFSDLSTRPVPSFRTAGHTNTCTIPRDPLVDGLRTRRLSDVNAFLANADREDRLRAELEKLQQELSLSNRWALERREAEARVKLLERQLQQLRQTASLHSSRIGLHPARQTGIRPALRGHEGKQDIWSEWEAEVAEEERLITELSGLSSEQRRALLAGKSSNACKLG
jgi:hypothetical protein